MIVPRPLIAGNWKMNGLKASAFELKGMMNGAGEVSGKVDLLICPPATLLMGFARVAEKSVIKIGAQDCHAKASGAHTGDISAEMIADAGGVAVIVGHSERRADHGETDGIVRAKAAAVIEAGLAAIICIGETEAEREQGNTINVVASQLAGSLPEGADPAKLIIAYEPVWAIGTGRTPTAAEVADVHSVIRNALIARFSDAGEAIRILYGGSVKPANAEELMAVPNVNGALVGGASLKASDFLAIAAAC
ncbi:MAG: triose-phosphate isomerase [Methylocystis sp.]|nr:triose-phosphate isomerase [Methylocystis sp.]MCA3586231.1 triose-phosphate isomerase [Methylocystis sp.]MCA3588539.1 triose-phosphate isomerase [Methylocystis sp.]MCA3591153.1 triose-phosphate isomerase [Methylocystis sp.]